jgi:hypothetical protein
MPPQAMRAPGKFVRSKYLDVWYLLFDLLSILACGRRVGSSLSQFPGRSAISTFRQGVTLISAGVLRGHVFWRIAILGFFLVNAIPAAWAQVQLKDNNSISAYGLTATISNFSCSGGAACSSNDMLEVVETGRGTITFEVSESTGSHIFSTAAPTSETMSFQSVITPTLTYLPLGSKASSAVLTTTCFKNLAGSK